MHVGSFLLNIKRLVEQSAIARQPLLGILGHRPGSLPVLDFEHLLEVWRVLLHLSDGHDCLDGSGLPVLLA